MLEVLLSTLLKDPNVDNSRIRLKHRTGNTNGLVCSASETGLPRYVIKMEDAGLYIPFMAPNGHMYAVANKPTKSKLALSGINGYENGERLIQGVSTLYFSFKFKTEGVALSLQFLKCMPDYAMPKYSCWVREKYSFESKDEKGIYAYVNGQLRHIPLFIDGKGIEAELPICRILHLPQNILVRPFN